MKIERMAVNEKNKMEIPRKVAFFNIYVSTNVTRTNRVIELFAI
jgi:hypothetical protein